MTQVDGEAVRLKGETDDAGWEVDPDDEWGLAVVATVGRQLKLRRESVGMRAGKFGEAVGYGEDMIYKLESGKRIPRPEFLDKADEVLGAGGLLSAMKEDVDKVRYPKKVRDLAAMEAKARSGCTSDSASTGFCRHRNTREPCSKRVSHPTQMPRWSDWSPYAWLGRLCSTGLPSLPSASYRKRRRCVVASEAQWSSVGNSNICWGWRSCATSRSR